jgi:hypothetical protein
LNWRSRLVAATKASTQCAKLGSGSEGPMSNKVLMRCMRWGSCLNWVRSYEDGGGRGIARTIDASGCVSSSLSGSEPISSIPVHTFAAIEWTVVRSRLDVSRPSMIAWPSMFE